MLLRLYRSLKSAFKNRWFLGNNENQVSFEPNVKIYGPYAIEYASIGAYTYVAFNSWISHATIGRFCSVGPNFLCGFGIHPTNGISTAPMFYSTKRQNGMTLSATDKLQERKKVHIGNDVFIGANVTVLDGITIGDGAVIGAGAVVTKDIPPYAIAVGCPIRILRYRFTDEQIEQLLKIQWWNWDDNRLKDVELYYAQIDTFIEKFRSV